MPLWTDIIDPATATGYIRASLADYENRQETLARWLPNRDIADIVVRLMQGPTGFIDIARWRAYDAEPEIGKRPAGKRVTLELPAVGQTVPISEYEQLRMRSGQVDEDSALVTVRNTLNAVAQSVANAVDLLRGKVLATGIATIDQDNFQVADNFGRKSTHTVLATTLWSSSTTTSRIDYLQAQVDVYRATNGEPPGCIVMSTAIFRALQAGNEMQTQLVGGGARRQSEADVNNIIVGEGLPPIVKFDRRVPVGGVMTPVVPVNTLLMLPEPVGPDEWQNTDLGATFWGRTLTSDEPDWAIPDVDQPGIVAAAWTNDRPPMIKEVISDAIALPVLANADRSFAAQVIA